MTALPLPDRLLEDEEWLLQAIDPRARLARLVRMDGPAYRDASFLDDRLLSSNPKARLCSLDELVEQSKTLNDPAADWIFHIGHVGSTLVSRLLGELGALSLREPRSLRDLMVASDAERPELARMVSRMMARRGDHPRVIVKATSFVSEFAPLLVSQNASVLFLYASPENYVAGILAGRNSVKELEALHDVRLARLRKRGIELDGFDKGDARRATLAWACEMASLEAADDGLPRGRVLWADFDHMLEDMAGWIARCARHFDLQASSEQVAELLAGPLMRRYSKATEYDYSPSLRAELLREAMSRNFAEIEAAMGELREAAKSAPLLDRALRRADGEF